MLRPSQGFHLLPLDEGELKRERFPRQRRNKAPERTADVQYNYAFR
jgi:hypothetical protein